MKSVVRLSDSIGMSIAVGPGLCLNFLQRYRQTRKELTMFESTHEKCGLNRFTDSVYIFIAFTSVLLYNSHKLSCAGLFAW